MNNETSLSAAIDRLSNQKAEEFIGSIFCKISTALQNEYRPDVAGKAFVRDDIFAVLKQYMDNATTGLKTKVAPSQTLVNGCRGTIVNNLLGGLPKIQELIELQCRESNDQ